MNFEERVQSVLKKDCWLMVGEIWNQCDEEDWGIKYDSFRDHLYSMALKKKLILMDRNGNRNYFALRGAVPFKFWISRTRIISAFVSTGLRTVCAVAGYLNLTEAEVRHHVNALVEDGTLKEYDGIKKGESFIPKNRPLTNSVVSTETEDSYDWNFLELNACFVRMGKRVIDMGEEFENPYNSCR